MNEKIDSMNNQMKSMEINNQNLRKKVKQTESEKKMMENKITNMDRNMKEFATAAVTGLVALKQRNNNLERQVSVRNHALVNQQVVFGMNNNNRVCLVRRQVVGINVNSLGRIDDNDDNF